MPKAHFEVGVEDVAGEVTVVAQVERVLDADDQYPAIRLLRGAPSSAFEAPALEKALPDLISGLGEIGVQMSEADIFMHGPALILRAICAYR